MPPNKALKLTGPSLGAIDPWYNLALELRRFDRGRSAGAAAELRYVRRQVKQMGAWLPRILVAVLLASHTISAKAAPLLLLGGDEGLYTVDPSSGQVSNPQPLGPSSYTAFAGLAFSSSLGLFTAANALSLDKALFRIDPATGAAIPVGPTLDDRTKGSLAFDPADETLFLGGLGFLATVDISTGIQSEVGQLDHVLSAMTFSPAGALLAIDFAAEQLVEIDKSDGSVIRTVDLWLALEDGTGRTGFTNSLGGMDFDPISGDLLLVNANDLFTLDPVTGLGRLLATDFLPTDVSGVGLAFVPEPGTGVLVSLGLFALACGRRSTVAF